MNPREPFQPSDLDELDELLSRADAVVAMEDLLHVDNLRPGVIGMRHDVDNAITPSVQMAEWEAERGYRSTYFILHTAPYWQEKDTLQAALEAIAECGHEIGFHLNAITAGIETGRDPVAITAEALGELRGYGYPVRGVVAHGDNACYQYDFVNDELFLESRRREDDSFTRMIGGRSGRIHLRPVSRLAFGFEYDPNWMPRGEYLSDSGGEWSQPFEGVADRFPDETGQLHLLVHPDWWPQAFAPVRQAA